jgi:membrane fusion protein (multidrug efflux system)
LALEQQKNAVKASVNEQATKVAPVKSQIQQSSASLNNAKLFLSYTVLQHLMTAGLERKPFRKDS